MPRDCFCGRSSPTALAVLSASSTSPDSIHLLLSGLVGPDAGVAVGLQFLAYQQAVVAFHVAAAGALRVDLARHAGDGLDVVADFMCDNVGFCEIAAAEARAHFFEKAGVEVNLLVARTVEWPNRGRGLPARRCDGTGKQHEFRRGPGAAAGLKNLGPGVFGRTERGADELRGFVIHRCDRRAGRRTLR